MRRGQVEARKEMERATRDFGGSPEGFSVEAMIVEVVGLGWKRMEVSRELNRAVPFACATVEVAGGRDAYG